MAKRRQFDEEFKREAIQLVESGRYTNAAAAQSLGIGANLLLRWREKFRQEQEGASPMPEPEQEELRRLREENRRLRMERDILKKATAFFANEKN